MNHFEFDELDKATREEICEMMVDRINKWWDSWHRFAEEDDLPPTYIEDMIYKLNTEYGMHFDHVTGKWRIK